MRIASLVPSATEMLFALGLGDERGRRHPRVRLPAGRARAAAPDRDRPARGPQRRRDRRRREGDRRRRQGALQPRRGAAGGAGAGPDRHPGGLRRLRRLLRGRGRGRGAAAGPAAGRCSRTRAAWARCWRTSPGSATAAGIAARGRELRAELEGRLDGGPRRRRRRAGARASSPSSGSTRPSSAATGSRR